MTEKAEQAQKIEKTDKAAERTEPHGIRDPIAGLLAQCVVYGSVGYIALISVVGLFQTGQGWKDILTITLHHASRPCCLGRNRFGILLHKGKFRSCQ